MDDVGKNEDLSEAVCEVAFTVLFRKKSQKIISEIFLLNYIFNH